MSTAPTELERLVRLSAALTGVSGSQLKPALDPIGIAGQYLRTLQGAVGAGALGDIFTAFEQASTSHGTDAAAGAVLDDPVHGPVCRSVIKLWLLGAWYDPLRPGPAVNVVSAQSYKESLVWKVMQSHPMGYSVWEFGYWAEQPPSLDQFITFDTTDQNGGAGA